MYQNYQDVINICISLGPPDYFITFTYNPRRFEITDALMSIPTQKVQDRPDIVASVFHIRMKQFLKDLKSRIFKTIIASWFI